MRASFGLVASMTVAGPRHSCPRWTRLIHVSCYYGTLGWKTRVRGTSAAAGAAASRGRSWRSAHGTACQSPGGRRGARGSCGAATGSGSSTSSAGAEGCPRHENFVARDMPADTSFPAPAAVHTGVLPWDSHHNRSALGTCGPACEKRAKFWLNKANRQ